ncbi:hypothetical protein LAJ55_16210, partial [Streptococcus pneumoniae]|uniref:hypothetical protein n=1 Tax=Streptococcus pneumoniae TaxID=1313 RepID=UPI001CBBA7D7
ICSGGLVQMRSSDDKALFLTLNKEPTRDIDWSSEVLLGENACTLLLENDANRGANEKVLNSFEMIMKMLDHERRM